MSRSFLSYPVVPAVQVQTNQNPNPNNKNSLKNLLGGEMIAEDAVKMTPETDLWPPVIHSSEWSDPIPMPGAINTAGVENAPVISAVISTFTPNKIEADIYVAFRNHF